MGPAYPTSATASSASAAWTGLLLVVVARRKRKPRARDRIGDEAAVFDPRATLLLIARISSILRACRTSQLKRSKHPPNANSLTQRIIARRWSTVAQLA
jgi:hypothetical protein